MEIKFDQAKREKTMMERGLDFARCTAIFAGPHIMIEDDRLDYGESRFITYGYLDEREVVVVWTPRGDCRRVISMRKANEREKDQFYKFLG